MTSKSEAMSQIRDLPDRDRIIYGALARAAKHGLPCPTADDLVEMSGLSSVSGTVDAMHRLENRGLIEVRRFQRSRQVRIVETNEWTSLPLNCAPHWRDRPREVPGPSVTHMRDKYVGLAADMERWARGRGVSFADALVDLAWVGWKVEMERG